MEVHGSASSAAPALVAAALAGIDVTFVETDELSAEMLGPFDSADLVLRTPRGCVHRAGAVLRFLWRASAHGAPEEDGGLGPAAVDQWIEFADNEFPVGGERGNGDGGRADSGGHRAGFGDE